MLYHPYIFSAPPHTIYLILTVTFLLQLYIQLHIRLYQNLTGNLPFIVAFFSVNVPSGLALYWIVNNAMTTAITAAVKNSLKDEPVPAEVDRMMAQVSIRYISDM